MLKFYFFTALLTTNVIFAAVQTTPAPAQGVLLVSCTAERQVAVIDLDTHKVIATLPTPAGPHEITLSPDGTQAYVADTGSGPGGTPGDSVVALDLKERKVRATFKVCERPHDTRVSSDGRLLWVACAPMQAVLEVDATSGAMRKTWKMNHDGGWFVETSPNGRRLFVPHLEGKALTVIDRQTGEVRSLLSATTKLGVGISPQGNEVWITDADENKISIVAATNSRVLASIALGTVEKGKQYFSRLRFTPDGRRVLVVRGSTFMILDSARRSIIASIDLPHEGKVITVSGDSRRAFVSHPNNNSVSTINLIEQRVETTFIVGKQPDGLAWIPRY